MIAHELVLLLGTAMAIAMAITKGWNLWRLRKQDHFTVLRGIAVAIGIWLAVVWFLQFAGVIPIGPPGLSFAVPGVVGLLALEIVHAFVKY